VPFNILAIISLSLITIFYTLFNFTKEPRSKNLLKRRESQAVTFSDLAILLLCYYLSAAYTPGNLSNYLALIFSLIQVGLSLVKISKNTITQNSESF
jgi:membrane-associated HD superfamily phosphohydrolase